MAVAYSPNDPYLAAGYADGVVLVWNAKTFQAVHTLHCHAGYVWSVLFTADGKSFVSSSGHHGRGEIKIWNLTALERGERK